MSFHPAPTPQPSPFAILLLPSPFPGGGTVANEYCFERVRNRSVRADFSAAHIPGKNHHNTKPTGRSLNKCTDAY